MGVAFVYPKYVLHCMRFQISSYLDYGNLQNIFMISLHISFSCKSTHHFKQHTLVHIYESCFENQTIIFLLYLFTLNC